MSSSPIVFTGHDKLSENIKFCFYFVRLVPVWCPMCTPGLSALSSARPAPYLTQAGDLSLLTRWIIVQKCDVTLCRRICSQLPAPAQLYTEKYFTQHPTLREDSTTVTMLSSKNTRLLGIPWRRTVHCKISCLNPDQDLISDHSSSR